MENQGKKSSLFKQKIKLIKEQKQQQNVGFPAAVKIVERAEGPMPDKKDSTDNQQNLNCNIKPKASIIGSINKEGVVSNEEMRKIEGQNWEKVKSMSEQERHQMLKMINSQLPQNFLSRLRQGGATQKQNESKQEKFVDPPKKEEIEEEEQKWWESIHLNIETQGLQFKQESNDNLVNIGALSLMIGSQNNQSQIVAGKLISKFIGKLCQLTTQKSRQLIVVDRIPLHLGIVLEKVSYSLLQMVVRKARSTNFRSVFIELITRLCESITHANRYLSKQSRLRLSQNMKPLRQKTAQFDMKQDQSKEIKDSLAAVEVLLFKSDSNLNDTNWQTLLNSMEFITELSLLEEMHSNYTNKYSFHVYNALKASSDYNQITGIINFLFELSNRLILKKNRELYVNILMMRERWQAAIGLGIEKMQSRIGVVQIQLAFKMIALARFVGGQTWYCLQNEMKPFLEGFHHLWQFLLFNTLSDMKGSQLHEDDIYSINHLLSWLFAEYHTTVKVKSVNPNFVLNTLMELFLNEDEFYSQLDQKVLDSLLCVLASLPEIDFNSFLNEEKIRSLIKNYSYNSFGNAVFTRLMLVVAIKSQPNLEGLLLRQVMLPYPDIFQKIGQGCGRECMVDSAKKGSNSDLKEEIASKIEINSQSRQNNKFMIYLSY